jgi:hypothetical protein
MNQIHYFFKPFAISITFTAIYFLIAAVYRGRQIPQCFHCGAIKVRSSPPFGFRDIAGKFLSGSVLPLHGLPCTVPRIASV